MSAIGDTGDIEAETEAGGKRKVVLILLLVVVLAAGAAYWFVLRPSSASAKSEPEPGVVVTLEAVQINLAGGHYLRLGLALQASKDAGAEVDGSKALDAAIDLFSGQKQGQLTRGDYRSHLKHALERRLERLYEGEVIGVYFTDFVTQ